MNVHDIERSIRFYTDAFGFTVVRRWGDAPRAAMLDMGDGSLLELFERPDAEQQDGRLLHIALHANDVNAGYERALAAGAKEQVTPRDVDLPTEEPYPVRIAFVVGPDGESVELFCERTA